MFKKKHGADETVANTIVTSDTVAHKTERHLAPLAPRPSLFRRRNLIIGGIVAVLVLAGATALVINQVNSAHRTALKQRDSLVDASVQHLEPQDSSKLYTIVKDLLANNTAADDPSSLYVVASYYVNISDSSNAERYIAKLEKLKPSPSDYRESIRGYVETRNVKTLKSDVAFAKSQGEETRKNTRRWDIQ
jgi:hypothetical protein